MYDPVELVDLCFNHCVIIQIESQAIQSLGQVTDSALLADVYNYCVTEGKIRSRDIPVSYSTELIEY